MNKINEMTKYLKKNRKLDQKKMISARIRTHVIEAFQNTSDEANKNGYSLSLASVIEEALEYSIAEYTEVSGKDFLQIEKDKLEDEWEKLQKENNQLKQENKSLIDKFNHANDRDYFEGGGREIDEFHNSLTETMKEVVSAIRSINPDAAFTIPSPKTLFESFRESERNKKVLAILHPYDFCESYWGSILPLIKWKDSTTNNPTNKEIMAEIDKVQESNKIDINLFDLGETQNKHDNLVALSATA
jgi:hypothetical protein